jgi:hypothetical protein
MAIAVKFNTLAVSAFCSFLLFAKAICCPSVLVLSSIPVVQFKELGSCLPFDGFELKLNTQASLLSFRISGIEVMFEDPCHLLSSCGNI